MKRILIGVLMLMAAQFASGQAAFYDAKKINARDTIKLKNRGVGEISIDTSFAAASDRKLASQKAIYDFVMNRTPFFVRYSDTATMLLPYLRKVDTTAMLAPYLRKVDTTAMLSPYSKKPLSLAFSGSAIKTATLTMADGTTVQGSFTDSVGTGGGGGSVTLAAVGSTPNANAATLTGSVLNLEPASATQPGVITASTQTFGGAKTFSVAPSIASMAGFGTGMLTVNNSGQIVAAAMPVSITDGDKTDITVTGTGAIWTIDNLAVTGGKIADATIAVGKLSATGTKDGTKFLRDDNTWVTPASSGVTSVSAIGSTPNANGATVSGTVLNLQPANGSFGGVLSTTTQDIAGEKIFANTTTSKNKLRVRDDALYAGDLSSIGYNNSGANYGGTLILKSLNSTSVGTLSFPTATAVRDWSMPDASGTLLVSASNGLTAASGNVKLGGSLIENTSTTTGNYNMNYTGTGGSVGFSKNDGTRSPYLNFSMADFEAATYASVSGNGPYGRITLNNQTAGINLFSSLANNVSHEISITGSSLIFNTNAVPNGMKFIINNLPTYEDNAAAGTGSHTDNAIYKTSNGYLKIKQASTTGEYKVLTGLFTQTGASAPSVTILHNTTGITPTAARSATGVYTLTFSAATLTANKTHILTSHPVLGRMLNPEVTSTTVATFRQGTPTTAADVMTNVPFEIRVYY